MFKMKSTNLSYNKIKISCNLLPVLNIIFITFIINIQKKILQQSHNSINFPSLYFNSSFVYFNITYNST